MQIYSMQYKCRMNSMQTDEQGKTETMRVNYFMCKWILNTIKYCNVHVKFEKLTTMSFMNEWYK
jgi:hypothetical protein